MSEVETTTIVLPKRLKHRLDGFKQFGRETYADIIERLVHWAEEDDESDLELSAETKKALARAEEDFRQGRVYTTEQLKKKLGI